MITMAELLHERIRESLERARLHGWPHSYEDAVSGCVMDLGMEYPDMHDALIMSRDAEYAANKKRIESKLTKDQCNEPDNISNI